MQALHTYLFVVPMCHLGWHQNIMNLPPSPISRVPNDWLYFREIGLCSPCTEALYGWDFGAAHDCIGKQPSIVAVKYFTLLATLVKTKYCFMFSRLEIFTISYGIFQL